MGTDLTPEKAFQEKIKDRLRDDIGDLIPDEVLAKMVEQSIQDIFFTKKVNEYGRKETSWLEEHTRQMFSETIRETINVYVAANKEAIIKMAGDIIREEAPNLLAAFFVESYANAAAMPFQSYDIQSSIAQKIREGMGY